MTRYREQKMNLYNNTKIVNVLKASLPFLPVNMQKNISFMIKACEFNTLYCDFSESIDETLCACSESNTAFNANDLIYAIKPYLSPSEFNTINTFLNLQNLLNIYKSGGNNMLNIINSLAGTKNPVSSDSGLSADTSIDALKSLLNNKEGNKNEQ